MSDRLSICGHDRTVTEAATPRSSDRATQTRLIFAYCVVINQFKQQVKPPPFIVKTERSLRPSGFLHQTRDSICWQLNPRRLAISLVSLLNYLGVSIMSIIQQSIARADGEMRYLTPGEMDQIKDFLRGGDRRLQLVKALTESRDAIIKKAASELFWGQPNLVSPGGNAFDKEMTATCLRDMDYYLRLVTYSVATGDATPIQEIGVIGARQMYQSLGTPLNAMAESVRQMKAIAISLVSAKDADEVGTYFDYLINALQ